MLQVLQKNYYTVICIKPPVVSHLGYFRNIISGTIVMFCHYLYFLAN